MSIWLWLLAGYGYCQIAYSIGRLAEVDVDDFFNGDGMAFGAVVWPILLAVIGIVGLVKTPWWLGEAIASIPRRIRERKIRKLERTRRIVEEYAKAAGVEAELATADQVADVERKLFSLHAATNDLEGLKRKLEAQSEASREVTAITAA